MGADNLLIVSSLAVLGLLVFEKHWRHGVQSVIADITNTLLFAKDDKSAFGPVSVRAARLSLPHTWRNRT